MRTPSLLVPRAAFTGFCLLTSVYCLLAFLPFTYQQVIDSKIVGWTGDFALLHPWLFWIAFVCAAWTLAEDYRPGTRALVVGFLAAGVVSGVVVVASPLLAGIRNEFRNLVWAGVWLLPLWWVAIVDLAGPGRRLVWGGRDDVDGARVFWGCAVAGVATALIYVGIHVVRGSGAPSPPGGEALTPAIAGWSVVLHLMAFLGLFVIATLVRALASPFRAPAFAEFVLLVLVESLLLVGVLRIVVFPAVSLLGTPGLVMAWAYATSLAVAAAGVAVRLWPASEPVRSGVELAARPFDLPLRAPVALRVVMLALWVGGAYVLAVSSARMDWNYLVQSLAALAVWLIGLVWIFGALPRTGPQRLPVVLVMAACPAALLFGYRALVTTPASSPVLGFEAGHRTALLDRYAGYDVSFRILHNLVRAEPGASRAAAPDRVDMGALFELLQVQTNIPRTVKIDVPDLNLVPAITRPAGRLPHIFMVVIDSLRQDYLSPYNSAVTFTPAIGRFAQDAGTVVFRQAFTRYGATGLSEPAIWTGRMMPHQQYPSPFGQANSLQKLLRAIGYEAYVSRDVPLSAVLSPWPELIELDKGIPNRDYDVRRSLEELERRLRGRDPGASSPVFAFTQPQNIHVSAITREGATNVDGGDYAGFYAPYASRVRLVDTAFGRFVETLRELGIYDDSIVILTSDHGDSLGEDGRFGHAYTIYPEILRIPILVHLPSWLRGLSVDPAALAMSTDLTPTLYYLLGQRDLVKAPIVGRPLFTERAEEREAYRQDGFVVASSYGPVYGYLTADAASLYIADATNYREYAYDLTTGVAGTPRPVTAAWRGEGAARIRAAIEEIARTYRIPGVR